MAKKGFTELTTLAPPPARSVPGGEPRVIRVYPVARYGRVRHYLDGWLPVPACFRRLDGRTVRGVALAAALAFVAAGAGALALWRLLGAR